MVVNLLSGIVRIVSGRHIGTGFVVSEDGLILTCAHVLGSSMLEKAWVVFHGTDEEREATVLAEGWRAVDAEDVAVLRVCGVLPEGAQPLPLGSSQGIEGHAMVTFGYPETGEVEGIRGTGTILGHGTRTKAGQALLQLRSSEITKGFGGTPVWDEVRFCPRHIWGAPTESSWKRRYGKRPGTHKGPPRPPNRPVPLHFGGRHPTPDDGAAGHTGGARGRRTCSGTGGGWGWTGPCGCQARDGFKCVRDRDELLQGVVGMVVIAVERRA